MNHYVAHFFRTFNISQGVKSFGRITRKYPTNLFAKKTLHRGKTIPIAAVHFFEMIPLEILRKLQRKTKFSLKKTNSISGATLCDFSLSHFH